MLPESSPWHRLPPAPIALVTGTRGATRWGSGWRRHLGCSSAGWDVEVTSGGVGEESGRCLDWGYSGQRPFWAPRNCLGKKRRGGERGGRAGPWEPVWEGMDSFPRGGYCLHTPSHLWPPIPIKVKLLSRVRLLAAPWTVAHQVLHPWDFQGSSAGVGCYFLL